MTSSHMIDGRWWWTRVVGSRREASGGVESRLPTRSHVLDISVVEALAVVLMPGGRRLPLGRFEVGVARFDDLEVVFGAQQLDRTGRVEEEPADAVVTLRLHARARARARVCVCTYVCVCVCTYLVMVLHTRTAE